ncbi:MAG: GAG-pre-integrase domain-containing protein, partial [Nitrosopumilaceae archaeon]|nr:GAG-pre-integrase domain-containing protein [Nitrosopumilaceae archaeon]
MVTGPDACEESIIDDIGSHDPIDMQVDINSQTIFVSKIQCCACHRVLDNIDRSKPHPKRLKIVLDSGASNHFFPCKEHFKEYNDTVKGLVALGNNNYKLKIMGEGTIGLKWLGNVLHVPEMSIALVSVSKLDKDGFEIKIGEGKAIVLDENGNILMTAKQSGGLYHIDKEYRDQVLAEYLNYAEAENFSNELEKLNVNGFNNSNKCTDDDDTLTDDQFPNEEGNISHEVEERVNLDVKGSSGTKPIQTFAGVEPLQLLHRRLGHISETKIKEGLKNDVWTGAQYKFEDVKESHLKLCKECQEGRMKAFARVKDPSQTKVELFEKFGVDYKGKFLIKSVDGYTGFYLFCDFYSNYLAIFLVKSKDERVTLSKFKEFYTLVKTLANKYPSVMQCDYDTVLKSEKMIEWMRDMNIQLQMSAPYCHWQNG